MVRIQFCALAALLLLFGSLDAQKINFGDKATFGNYSYNCTAGKNGSPDRFTVDYPARLTTVQRFNSTTGMMVIAGTYTGNSPITIQARYGGGQWADIATLQASPDAKVGWRGRLEVPVGQWRLEIRNADDPGMGCAVPEVLVGDVYVIAGQSNAVGHGFTMNEFDSSLRHNATMHREDGVWRILSDPPWFANNSGSPWPALGGHIVENEDVPVSFITSAKDGVEIAQWVPGGRCYDNMIRQIAHATNGTMLVNGILYFQGEADDGLPWLGGRGCMGNYSCYKAALSKFITGVKKDTKAKKIVIGQIGSVDGKGVKERVNGSIAWVNYTGRAQQDAIRKAQQDMWEEDASVAPGPVTYDIGPLPDGLHFETDAQIGELAKRWWVAVDNAFYNGTYGRGPRVADVSANGEGSEIIITFNRSGHGLAENHDLRGFRIEQDGAAIGDDGIASADVIAPDKVKLVMRAPVSGDARLSYASYGDAYATEGVIREGGRFALPAEPAYSKKIRRAGEFEFMLMQIPEWAWFASVMAIAIAAAYAIQMLMQGSKNRKKRKRKRHS